ncbi:tetratricopeptide repeat protein [Methylocystis sp. ATCC 49242]|uniref:tetratricopeptide repeat protein n=1 Tax=Methylocystis sp. ATCC 49242 TaxID=622637 RepID=UPI0001F885F6|nr:tetratricopeptide repeat protein [Methylocystis sp. ATCC 49242]
MKAIISGEAAAAAILERDVEFRPAGGKPVENLRPYDVSRAFDGCLDLRLVEVKDKQEADALVELAWAEDRALRLFLFLLDSEEEDDDLKEYAECIEELMEYDGVTPYLERRLISNTIPVLVEINRVKRALESSQKTLALFSRLVSLQISIKRVREAFDQVEAEEFGGQYEKNHCLELLIDEGLIRELVLAINQGKDINFLRLQLISKHRAQSKAILKFMAQLQPALDRVPRSLLQEPETDEEYEHDSFGLSRDGDFQAYSRVRAQQKGIIDRLKVHDLGAAKRFADQLIEEQRRVSDKEHIAKSLCLLAQQAKQYEATELQLEWAELANAINPSDPMTSGHLADALIGKGDFVAAYEAIDQTERRGDPLYAATSRARIRRLEGHYAEAHELYLNAARAHDAEETVVHAWTGVAETLRDMGQYDQALSQYQTLVKRWENDGGLRSGLASLLMETGQYQSAIREFGIALQFGGGVVAENGRATAYKLAGNIEEALRLYDKILEGSPFNSATLCGRAEVFRANDDLIATLEAYKLAVDRAPHSPRTWAGLGSVLEDLGRYDEARQAYAEGERRFPGDEFIAVGKARLLRREKNFAAALTAFEELSSKFPFNRWVKWARGDVLRRMGHTDAALQSMESILSVWSDYAPAKTSKAAMLIEAGRLDEAAALLDANEGQLTDWSRSVLRAAVSKARSEWDDALLTLTSSLSRARLPRERRFIKSAIAALDLQVGRPQAAALLAESKTGEITNVICFHALAAAGNRQKAMNMYKHIIQSEADNAYRGIVVEIARRFRITPGTPSHTSDWIAQQEDKALLLEVS